MVSLTSSTKDHEQKCLLDAPMDVRFPSEPGSGSDCHCDPGETVITASDRCLLSRP